MATIHSQKNKKKTFFLNALLNGLLNWYLLLLHWARSIKGKEERLVAELALSNNHWLILMVSSIDILWKYFYSLSPIFVLSTKCIDPWILEFVISNTTGNNQWESCILLDFNFRSLSEPRNPRKIWTPRLIMTSL